MTGTVPSFKASMISHENRIIQIVSESGFRIIMMNTAAPKRDAPAAVTGNVNAKSLLAPSCLGEAMRRGALPYMKF
jgi:hypothetical protein